MNKPTKFIFDESDNNDNFIYRNNEFLINLNEISIYIPINDFNRKTICDDLQQLHKNITQLIVNLQ